MLGEPYHWQDRPAPATPAPAAPGAEPVTAVKPAPAPPRLLLRLWLGTFALIAALGALWALSAPLGSGPDEAQQVVKAVGTLRGEWTGSAMSGRPAAFRRFTVPATYKELEGYADCYRAQPRLPASCAGRLPTEARNAHAASYVGKYPPLYYVLVGWPSLLTSSAASVYMMRLLSVAISAAALALAVALAVIYGESLLFAGVLLLAITPTLIYLTAVVEPNGLEASAATCLWTCCALLASPTRDRPPKTLIHVAGASAATLVLVRGLSVLWLVVTLTITLAVLMPRDQLAQLWGRLATRIWAVGVGVASAAAIAWVVGVGALAVVPGPGRRDGTVSVFRLVVGDTRNYLMEMVGVFNPHGTHLPLVVQTCFWAVALSLVAWAIFRGHGRERAAICLLIAAVVLLPPLLTAASASRDGIIWHGRYTLPIAVGVPILAGHVISRAAWARRRLPALTMIGAALALQVVGLYTLLRRFAVGTKGPVDIIFTHVRWQPPAATGLIVIGALVVVGIELAWFFVISSRVAVAVAVTGEPAS